MTFWRCRKITDATARPGRRVRALAPAIIAAATLIYATTPAHALLSNGEPAIDILGQFTSPSLDTTADYTKDCPNNGASALGFDEPTSVLVDTAYHRLFVMDADNDRILVFPLTGTNQISSKTASYVLGQSDFISCAENAGSLTGFYSWNDPTIDQLAFDSVNNRLFAMDYASGRVWIYNTATITNGMNAAYYVGSGNPGGLTQSKFFDTGGGGCTYCGGLAYDSGNSLLYVADTTNNRVLVFSVPNATNVDGENASYVIGQSSFTAGSANEGGSTGQAGLNFPIELALDPANFWLYVADYGNNRIMVFPAYGNAGWAGNGENASYVLGQSSFSGNSATTTQSGLNLPMGVAFDSVNNRLFEAEAPPNNRVMVFNTSSLSNGMNASSVIGESSFTAASYTPPVSQSRLNSPIGLSYDSGNSRLYVADETNNRVMEFNVATGATLSSPTQSGFDACAIGGGQLYCWGDNIDGEDGTGNSTTNETPVQIGAATNWTAVSEGDKTFDPAACGIAGGALYCWGENTYGEVGEGNTTPYNTPQQTALGTYALLQHTSTNGGTTAATFTSTTTTGSLIVACGYTSANLTTIGASDTAGNSFITAAVPTYNSSIPGSIGCVYAINRAATASDIVTMSGNGGGLFGGVWLAEFTGINTASPVDVTAAATGTSSIPSSGPATTTNANDLIFGVSFISSSDGPGAGFTALDAPADDQDEYKVVSATGSYSATFTGSNASWIAQMIAFKAATNWISTNWSTVSTSGNDTCAINTSGALYCWGRNEYGELGQGNTIQQTSPVQITSPSETWSTVSTGGTDTCAITTAGALYCWGRNNEGQDGIGSTSQQTTPQQVASPSTTWASVSQGSDDTCAITTGGALYCWGYNRYGEDGQGNTTQYSTPQATGTSISTTGWTAVTAQYDGTNDGEACGIASGALYCWGRNHRGEGGIGSTTQTTSPAQVGSATNWSSVSFGDYDTCGVAGSQLYCWGYNHQYEDGVGNTTENTSPVAVGSGFIGTDENAIDELGEYNSPSSTSTVLWTANGANNGPTALGIDGPYGTALDTANHYLYVVDSSNNRVLVYTLNVDNSIPTSSGGHTASYVLGQTSLQGASVYGDSMSQLNYPSGVAFDPVNQRLFVSDYGNARVLAYNVSGGVTNGMSASNYVGGCYGATQACLAANIGIAYDAVNSRLFVAEANNSRVMVFNVAPGFSNGENASYVLGQPNFTSGSANQGGSPAQNTLNEPNDVAYDPVNSRLFVGDDQQRVMVFNVAPGTIATNENASYVIGEPDFITTNCPGSPQSCVSGSSGLGYDPNNNRLFVASIYNDTVLVFNVAPGQISNGMNASYELGCTSFGTNCYGTTQSNLLNPGRVFYDPGSGRLFVGDGGNNRVIIFDATFGSPNFLMMMPD